ncbi:MAG: endonuclease/exonuclease/phosphatase family protein [Candidatus Hydrogenedentes bacterium]|nr:endonuclease/exonuclease/phosphatase family protein [Candidatus Hydrogenedentota bacterium]
MTSKHITIVSHNAFWFQGHPFETDAPEDPVSEIVAGLEGLYRSKTPDVICLQEIQSEFAFRCAREALDMDGAYCPGGHYSQYGGATLWRRGKLIVDIRSVNRLPQRMWQITAVARHGAEPLTVANVHLASARHLGEDGAAPSRIQDLEQMLTQKVRPLVVAGDFNEAPDGGASEYMASQGYVDTAPLTSHPEISTGINKARSDQIWVHRSLREHVEEFGVIAREELKTTAAGKELLSDHQPLWLRLKLNGLR